MTESIQSLNPCPFCRYDFPQSEINGRSKPDGRLQYYIWCPSCCCRGPLAVSEVGALIAWNRRVVEIKGGVNRQVFWDDRTELEHYRSGGS